MPDDPSDLLQLAPPTRRLSPVLRDARGGFAWWYADLVNDAGDGMVLIAAHGLPFLPGYASAHRRDNAPRAGDRPSLNLAVYRGGRRAFYLLHEFAPDEVTWEDDPAADRSVWRFGETTLTREIQDGQVALDIDINTPLPRDDRAVGQLRIHGPLRKPATDEPRPTSEPGDDLAAWHHDWTPITTATQGSGWLEAGGERFAMSGRAYHDRNGSAEPLHALGIRYWLWGRAPLPNGSERIWYLVWPRGSGGAEPVAIGLEIGPDGSTRRWERLPIERRGGRRGWAGLRVPREVRLGENGEWLRIVHDRLVDDGPFYQRWLVQADAGGQAVTGIAEAVAPDRVDRWWHRPLVRMAVQHSDPRRNSRWLPLFAGLTRTGAFGAHRSQ